MTEREEIIEGKNLTENKIYKVKANLLNIFHYLTPKEEVFVINNVKCRVLLNFIKDYDYQELISIMLRSCVYGMKFDKAKNIKPRQSKANEGKVNFDYIFHVLTNKWNLSQIFTSVVIHKPFLIPFNIYKSIGEKICDLNKKFCSNSSLEGESLMENKNVDIYLISNLEQFLMLLSESTINYLSFQPALEIFLNVFKQSQNYFDNLSSIGIDKFIQVYKSLPKSKKITIDSSDVRILYKLNDSGDYFIKKNSVKTNADSKSNKGNKQSGKEDFYDWNEFFEIQKSRSFYNSFFSYDFIIFNNANYSPGSSPKNLDDCLALFIHSNAELDSQDKELLDCFTNITNQKLLMNVVEKLKLPILKKKSNHMESYIEFDSHSNQQPSNLKLILWMNIKMAGYHFIKLKPLYHYGRFIVIKFISCSTVPSCAFYGHMLEY